MAGKRHKGRLTWSTPYFGVRHGTGGSVVDTYATVVTYANSSELFIIGTVEGRPYQTIGRPESFFGYDHAGKAMLRAEQRLCLGE